MKLRLQGWKVLECISLKVEKDVMRWRVGLRSVQEWYLIFTVSEHQTNYSNYLRRYSNLGIRRFISFFFNHVGKKVYISKNWLFHIFENVLESLSFCKKQSLSFNIMKTTFDLNFDFHKAFKTKIENSSLLYWYCCRPLYQYGFQLIFKQMLKIISLLPSTKFLYFM